MPGRRERKRAQMQTLSVRSLELEQENAYLKEALGMRDTEVAGLRDKLASMEASASLPRGADGSTWTASKAEPAVLNGEAPLPMHDPAGCVICCCIAPCRIERSSGV